MRAHKHKLLTLAIASFISTPFAFAQEAADDSPILEEMLVTAQKRVQKLQDVPISVNALSSEKIENTGITNIEKLGDYIPSFNMTQTGIGTNIAIRGISSGVNQGFEQSAAQFVDGIHFGRSQLARAPFLDIERVEVLRGPQSILFGKNSTAGAVSITTAKPGDEFEAKLTALYEPEHGERDFRFVISSPIGETMGMRVAILDSSMDGYMENTTLNRDESGDENRVVRGTFTWEPTDAWDVALKLENGSFDSEGRNIEVIKPVNNPNVTSVTPYKNILQLLTNNTYSLDTTHDFKRQSNGDHSYNNTENVTLNVDYTVGDHTITSVTGRNAYDYEELCDCDFTGAPGFTILSNEDYSQFSQELRIASSEDQTFSYLAGAFYQTSDLKFNDTIGVPVDSFIPTGLFSTIGAASNLLRGAGTQRDFDQTTDLYAVFAQGTWNFTDDMRLILGARYTSEDKEASRKLNHVAPDGTVLPIGSPTDTYNVLWRLFRVEPHDASGSRSESDVNPQVTLQYDLNDTDMVYVTYTTGFKSGGYDTRANSISGGLFFVPGPGNQEPEEADAATAGSFEFENEEADNIEIGGKFLLAGGALELNTALFRSEFTNMQTSQFDGSLSFNVTNAGEAVVQGLEVDSRWAITDDLLWRGGFAYIDFEYTNFPNSQCYFGQTDNIGPSNDGICDATGKRREFTPELQGNTGLDYTIGFNNGLKLVSTVDLIYSDEYFTTPSLDPKMVQEEFTKVNARIALSGNDDMWELALIGRNLTDESIITYANGLPVATTLTSGTASGYYAFYERTRSIALQGTVRF